MAIDQILDMYDVEGYGINEQVYEIEFEKLALQEGHYNFPDDWDVEPLLQALPWHSMNIVIVTITVC